MSTPRVVTIHACRHCGAGAPLDAHFCPQCDKILSLARHGDYFVFFGLPRRLSIDAKDLERRLRGLSRQFHPDFFYNSTPAERLASLERSSYMNDAYRTLRDPAARVEYLLKLEGLAPKGRSDASRHTPPDLLEEVFALNEELEAVHEAKQAGRPEEEIRARLERARAPIDRRRAEHGHRLETLIARWDRQQEERAAPEATHATLEALRQWVLEQAYLDNLVENINRILPAGQGPGPAPASAPGR